MLLDVHHVKHALERGAHGGREDRRVVRLPVIIGRKPDRVEQRIDLELFLDDLVIGGECVRIGIDQDVARLAFDHPAQRFRDRGVVAGKADVGPDDSARVAQPLRPNVAGRYVRRPVALRFDMPSDRLVVRGRVERIQFRAEQGWERCLGRGRRSAGAQCQQSQHHTADRELL